MRIIDRNNQTRDWNWLVGIFGPIEIKPAPADAPAWRVVELAESVGPATLIVKLLGAAGHPVEGVLVARTWPDESLPFLPESLQVTGAKPNPFGRILAKGVFGPTNTTGDIGFGMGRGDYYFLPSAGASTIWCEGLSDQIVGLGMLGGTEHQCIRATFQKTGFPVPEPEPEPEPQPEPGNVWEARWAALLSRLDAIIELLKELREQRL